MKKNSSADVVYWESITQVCWIVFMSSLTTQLPDGREATMDRRFNEISTFILDFLLFQFVGQCLPVHASLHRRLNVVFYFHLFASFIL
ncbi:hypothetical protein T4B_14331 [Trichinella pseudospiralis]|uniref:Uncharacterized protein n=2 Tax=Trichinella pseudospiralis TaxID=6337 RepID=A0A0V1FJN3_TRIPS|nr:hypothetical protein T4E_8167 [Trichinella pseudospiralis]KRY86085.1 hypothetical protein T4D_13919 [Trichinella pseudospiralis]KRZ30363.1 hypothetical protein T4B_14331 [Trichinella pseudospiralis]